MSTFEKVISYKSRVLRGTHHVIERVEKKATFNELNEMEQGQHKLHFKIMSLYRTRVLSDSEETKVAEIDTDILYDLTVLSVKSLAVVDDEFTEIDLREFLGCSLSILKFGMWFLENHILPFIKEYANL
jgi:hypothetical protein